MAAVLVAYLSLSCPLLLAAYDCSQSYGLNVLHIDSCAFFGCYSYMGSSKPNAPYGCNLSKYQHSNHSPKSGYALEVFKGKEAKLNLAILIILEQHGPLIILEILDLLHKIPEFKNVYLGSLTKRVHALEGEGYIMQVSTRKPKRGSKAAVYAIRSNALLAQVLNWMDPNALATKANDDQALTIASYIMLVLSPDGQELECAVA